MSRIVCAVCVLAVAALPAAAQETVASRLAGRLPQPAIQAISAIADSAMAQSLPVDPLVDKAIEGAAKGVPADRVTAAVRTVFQQLAASATALRGSGIANPAGESVEAGAFALAAGLSPAYVGNIARAGGADRAAAALRVAGALTALGVPAPQAAGLVTQTLSDSGSMDDLSTLPARVEANMAHGQSPAAAAAAAGHGNPSPPRRPAGDHGRKP